MKTLNVDIIMNQGDDFSRIIAVPLDSGFLDLTGYSFSGQMRLSNTAPNPPIATFQFTVLNQLTNKGQVQWSLSRTVTATIPTSVALATEEARPVTPYVYDVKMTDTLGKVTRIIQGLIKVSPQVTL